LPQSDALRDVILLAYYYLPDNTSGVQRAVRFGKYLPTDGSHCYVICSSHAGDLADNPDVLHVPSGAASTRWSAVAAILQRILPYNEQLPWVPHAVAAGSSLVSRSRISALISTSPPAATHLAALWLKRRHGLKWIADFRDPILGNPGRSRRWARPYDAALQWWIFKNADAVIAVTDAVADEWRRHYPKWAHKFHVIWNGFDPENGFGPLPIPRRAYKTLCHVGVLYALRHPVSFMSALDRLTRSGRLDPHSVRIRFIGPIQEESRFRGNPSVSALIANGCLEISGELIPRAHAMQEIASSDFLLLIDIVNLSKIGYTVPAKLYDYILTGRPILTITDRNSPTDRILAKSGVLYSCLYHDDSEAEVDRKLLSFFELPTEPATPSTWFFENFDGKRQAATLSGLMNALAGD
jgi:glycosyltransferase involved in cell wall biosynthesis